MKLIYVILLLVVGMIAIDTFALIEPANQLARWGVRTVIMITLVGAGIVWSTDD